MALGTVNVPSGSELDLEKIREQILRELSSEEFRDQLKQELDFEEIREQIKEAVGSLSSTACFYTTFEAEDWTKNELRIPQAVHGYTPTVSACLCTVRRYFGRNVRPFKGSQADEVKEDIVEMVREAIAANKTTPNTYPSHDDGNGHIILTWEQIQLYVLEGKLLPAAQAASTAEEKNINWKPAEDELLTAMLDTVLAAAYIPALGGEPVWLDRVWSADTLLSLGMRYKVSDAPDEIEKYDTFGTPTKNTWGLKATETFWDVETKELVIQSTDSFYGDVLVLAPGASGAISSGGEMSDEDYQRLLASLKKMEENMASFQAQTVAELKKKGDKLDYDGEKLSLLSGDASLSSVPMEGGEIAFATDEEFGQMLDRVYGSDE